MSKWERKFGKYAISNLTVVLIACYVIGYVLTMMAPAVLNYLTLDPYAILHGQIWRIFTWVICPPTSIGGGLNFILVVIMLFFYFSLGTSLERVWGTWKYNVYIFTGLLLTIAGSFLSMGLCYLVVGDANPEIMKQLFQYGALQFSTYYINMSIFLAYAATFPNAEVLLMFIIPVKVKWMGVVYGAMLCLQVIQSISQGILSPEMLEQARNGFFSLDMLIRMGSWFGIAAAGASLANFVIFWLRSRNHIHMSPKQIKRRAEFRQDIRKNPKVTKHVCAICGQSEESNPDLEFRFCSKCNGNYEYCQNHLFTHEHKK